MTEAHRAVVARLSADFASISQQMARVSADLRVLDQLLTTTPQPVPAPQPVPYPMPYPAPFVPYAPPPAGYWPPAAPPPPQPVVPPRPPVPPPAASPQPSEPRSEGWIGKVLAVAGVTVTLTGVVLLLVLAAQAGILRPELRVAAGAVLAAGLVAAGIRLNTRPGGRVGAIALAATGVAAAYIDVIAVTTVYAWVAAPVGLVLAAVIAGGGLTLARRWDSEHLGLLVLVPLIGLAPVVTDGITLLLLAFMLALAAASLPVQLGRDWIWLHAARVAACTLPLLVALAATGIGGRDDVALAGACAIAALLAVISALILLPYTANRAAMAVLTCVGALPVLSVSLAVGRAAAALMIAALAATMLALALIGDRLPGVPGIVRQVWSALSAVAALVAVTVAFDGEIAAPVLLAMALLVAIAGRADDVARWSAIGFGVVGGSLYLSYAPPSLLVRATETSRPDAVSTLIASVLLGCVAVAVVRSWTAPSDQPVADDAVRVLWAGCAVVIGYAVTTFTVTAGVLVGGPGGGFLAGHMAATICWIAAAAGLFLYAARKPKAQRSMPIGGGLTLVAAAMAKLFLFDLGTLDGIFRVVVFIVTGLVLLGMGAGYARLLAQQDQQDQRV